MDLQKCIISDFLSLGNQIYDYASFDHGIAEQSAHPFHAKMSTKDNDAYPQR